MSSYSVIKSVVSPPIERQPQNTEKERSVVSTPSTVKSYKHGLINFSLPLVKDQSNNYEKLMKRFFNGKENVSPQHNSTPDLDLNESNEVNSSVFVSLNLSKVSSANLESEHDLDVPLKA